MNEAKNNKIKILKGKVSQTGHEDAICSFIEAGGNRYDSFSDKRLYIAEDLIIKDNIYAVTPNVTEALKRSQRRTIGVMNDIGELIVPIINSDIVRINDNYIAVKTTSSKQEIEVANSNPNKAQENAEISQNIKNKILGNDSRAEFICGDYYESYDIYEIKGNNLIRVFDNASYIAKNNDTIYLKTNLPDDEVQIIGKKNVEPNVTMPVDMLADVTNKPLDNLGELPEMPTELPGAPALTEGDNFKIEDVQKDLGSFANNIEMPIEEDVKPVEENFTKPIYEEKTFEEPVKKETAFKEEYKLENSYEEKDEISNTSITKIVSAVKATIAKSENERERLERENVEKDAEINRLKMKFNKTNSELKEKDEKIAEQAAEINRLKIKFNKVNSELKEVISENEEQKSEIYRLNDEVTKKDTKIATLKEKRREDIRKVTEAFSGIIDSGALEERNNRYIEDSNEDEYSYSMVA